MSWLFMVDCFGYVAASIATDGWRVNGGFIFTVQTPREGTQPASGLVVAYSDANWTPIRFDVGHRSDLKRTVVRADIGQFSGGIGLVSESWRKTKFVF